jgi:hypothetical protein
MHGAGNYEVLQSTAGVALDASQHFVIIGLELLDDKPGLRLAGQGIGQVPQRGILRFLDRKSSTSGGRSGSSAIARR